MTRFEIPRRWTTSEDLLVMDFLEQVHSAIWAVYEEMTVEVLARQDDVPSTPSIADVEDDIPAKASFSQALLCFVDGMGHDHQLHLTSSLGKSN